MIFTRARRVQRVRRVHTCGVLESLRSIRTVLFVLNSFPPNWILICLYIGICAAIGPPVLRNFHVPFVHFAAIPNPYMPGFGYLTDELFPLSLQLGPSSF